LREAAKRLHVGTAIVHLGGVRFPISGPLRYTMTAEQAVELCTLLHADTIVPIHYEGWKHFRQSRDRAQRVLEDSPLRARVRWLQLGTPTELAV
jgi:L-ascorbate metabolism protein UlaG (beta-lactamase superfamily)